MLHCLSKVNCINLGFSNYLLVYLQVPVTSSLPTEAIPKTECYISEFPAWLLKYSPHLGPTILSQGPSTGGLSPIWTLSPVWECLQMFYVVYSSLPTFFMFLITRPKAINITNRHQIALLVSCFNSVFCVHIARLSSINPVRSNFGAQNLIMGQY